MLTADLPILSLLIWLPILGGIGVLATRNDDNAQYARLLSLLVTVVCFTFSVLAYLEFDNTTSAMQLGERFAWVPQFNIEYYLGVDGFSFPLILLTNLMGIVVVAAGWQVIQNNVAKYMAAFLMMQGLMCGVFAALDGILFYVFWEAMLIPMFMIIGIWGGPNRIYATIKFFLYTFLGSVLLLLALIYLYTQAGSFSILDFHQLNLSVHAQTWIFFAFLAAFAVKVPMWPVHTWLPDAHVEAPTGGSVILAAIMLKMGGYGFIRFSLPITPVASENLAWLMIALSLIAVVYIGFVAIAQKDMKKLIAYSSIAHMGFVTLGFFICFSIYANTGKTDAAVMGIEGAMVQMISHGFISGALFLCVGVLYDRMHTRMIKDYGGVANTMPIFAALMMVFAMANSGLPGTSGFVGEFLVVLSTFQANFWYAALAATVLILGPAYTLLMYKRVIYGNVANDRVAALTDVNKREFIILGSLVLLVLLFGVWPAPMIEMMHTTSVDFVNQLLKLG